jgi:hypothetical protein
MTFEGQNWRAALKYHCSRPNLCEKYTFKIASTTKSGHRQCVDCGQQFKTKYKNERFAQHLKDPKACRMYGMSLRTKIVSTWVEEDGPIALKLSKKMVWTKEDFATCLELRPMDKVEPHYLHSVLTDDDGDMSFNIWFSNPWAKCRVEVRDVDAEYVKWFDREDDMIDALDSKTPGLHLIEPGISCRLRLDALDSWWLPCHSECKACTKDDEYLVRPKCFDPTCACDFSSHCPNLRELRIHTSDRIQYNKDVIKRYRDNGFHPEYYEVIPFVDELEEKQRYLKRLRTQ